MPNLTDTHCHLNNPAFAGREAEVVARAKAAGVTTLVVPGWDAASSARALALAAEFPAVRAAVGLHPWFATAEPDWSWLPPLLDDPRVVAMGEIGLDGAIAHEDHALQEAVFRAQLTLAAARDLPVLLHCRRRWDRFFACLRAAPPVRGIVHAFSASREVMSECLALGLHIAFAGPVTRPNSRHAREAASIVPVDRLLLETDAPNMAMEGLLASEVEPAHLPRILAEIAHLRGDEPNTLSTQVAKNATALLECGAQRRFY